MWNYNKNQYTKVVEYKNKRVEDKKQVIVEIHLRIINDMHLLDWEDIINGIVVIHD